jgi:hypothetical protein
MQYNQQKAKSDKEQDLKGRERYLIFCFVELIE